MNNFLRTSDLDRETLESLLERAFRFKAGGEHAKPLDGKSVALVFFNPSLRTRASMQVAIYELGGNPVVIEPGNTSWTLEYREGVTMDGDRTEHLKEFVRVLGRYVSAIGVRTFAEMRDWQLERTDPILSAFAEYSEVPVINLESAMHHPCQAMADMMTIREKYGNRKKRVLLTWAWHPKALPMAVPNSFALAAAQFGHDLTIAHPAGYELDEQLVTEIEGHASRAGGSIRYTNDVKTAYDDIDVVYAKSWGSRNCYGNLEAELSTRAGSWDSWIVNAEKMSHTNDALFMHCLPVRRNVIVTDEVIDSPRSVVIDEAENRLHVQRSILTELLK